jgi:hypothetical protein
MSTHTILNDWLLGGPKPSRLSPDLVFGCIQWAKVLGLPDGKLDKAFFLYCYHYDLKDRNADQTMHLRASHVVNAWEGPHDDDYFRVSFVTDSRDPRGYDVGSKDPLRHLNLLQVSLHTGVGWRNNLYTGKGGKLFVPEQIVFDPPGKPQRLPNINVIHLQRSAH